MRKIVMIAMALAAAAAAILVPARGAVAAAYPVKHPPGYWVSCKPYFRRTISGPWGAYIIRDDVFKIPGVPRATVCLRHERGQPSFMVLSSDADSRFSLAYPEVFYGCVYGACSPGTLLPMRVGKLPWSFRISTYTRLSAPWRGGKFDAGFDIWFSRRRTTSGQAAGAEIMLWLYNRGVRFAPSWRVEIGGHWWLAEEWVTHNAQNGKSWPLIIFERQEPAAYAHRLHLRSFVRFAEQHGWMTGRLWLESVAQGYEIWQGGSHLTTMFFRVLP